METNITVTKADIINIGNTISNDNGFVSIICDLSTSGIEEILLRSILKCFGDYRITSSEDFFWQGHDTPDIEYTTDLPYELYEKELKTSAL